MRSYSYESLEQWSWPYKAHWTVEAQANAELEKKLRKLEFRCQDLKHSLNQRVQDGDMAQKHPRELEQ